MKENSNSQGLFVSKRAQSFLDSPVHFTEKAGEKKVQWTVLTDGDKILTLAYTRPTSSDFDALFLEVIAHLSERKTLDFINGLTFRETENYLRDENHLAVFDELNEKKAALSFQKIKNSLLSAVLLGKLRATSDLFLGNIFWNKLTFVEKNQRILTLTQDLNKVFSRGKPLQLALAMEEEITLIMNDFPFGCEVLELLFQEIFKDEFGNSSFKVVAAL